MSCGPPLLPNARGSLNEFDWSSRAHRRVRKRQKLGWGPKTPIEPRVNELSGPSYLYRAEAILGSNSGPILGLNSGPKHGRSRQRLWSGVVEWVWMEPDQKNNGPGHVRRMATLVRWNSARSMRLRSAESFLAGVAWSARTMQGSLYPQVIQCRCWARKASLNSRLFSNDSTC